MEPTQLILWAVCLGVAWIVLTSLTGADKWLKLLFGKSKLSDLESRVERLEKRVAETEKQPEEKASK